MSIFGQTDEQQAREGALPQLAVEKPTGFAENVASAWNEFQNNDALGAADAEKRQAYDDQINTIHAITGEQLPNPVPIKRNRIGLEDPISLVYNLFTNDHGTKEMQDMKLHDQAVDVIKNRLSPDDRDMIPSAADITAKLQANAKKIEATNADIASRSTIAGAAGQLVGQGAASITQPDMLMTLPLGAPVRATILARMLGEAAIGGLTQAAAEPAVQQQRGELGLEHGVGDALGNVGSAALGGAVIGGGAQLAHTLFKLVAKGGSPALEKVLGRPVTADEKALADSVMQDAAMDTATPYKDPTPETFAVKQENENVASEAALAERPIADEDITPTPIEQAKTIIEANAGNLRVLRNDDLKDIGVDANLMQFKAGGDANGVTDRLKGVQDWSTERAGVSLVYEFEDGRQIIADGHQRLGLAQRLAAEGKDVELPAIVLREVDGVTPQEARARAALNNIAEGTGTAQDAAKVLRDLGTTAAEMNLPPKGALVRDAEGLVNLNDNVFGMVINDRLSEQQGAIVGRLVNDPKMQDAIAGLLVKLKPYNAAEAESIVRQAVEAGATREVQTSLFGDEEIANSLYLERARVLDRGLKMIRRNVDTFRTLSERGDDISTEGNILNADANARRLEIERNLQQYITAQAHRKGVIGDALGKAAKSAQDTGRYSDAARQFVESINAAAQAGKLDGRAISGSGADLEPEFQGSQASSAIEQGSSEQVDDATLNMFDQPHGPATEDQSLRIANEIKQEFIDSGVEDIKVYHGTAADFDEFDLNKAMSGEGTNEEGFGVYLAENPEVAKYYHQVTAYSDDRIQEQAREYIREAGGDRSKAYDNIKAWSKELTSEMPAKQAEEIRGQLDEIAKFVKNPVGNVYEVTMSINKKNLIDFDKPFGEQSPRVKEALNSVLGSSSDDRIFTGADFQKEAAGKLDKLGIQGTTFFDSFSKRDGGGTRNYVVFNPKNARIERDILSDIRDTPSVKEKELQAGAPATNDAESLMLASTKVSPEALPSLDADLLDFHVPIGERLDEDGARRAATQSIRDIFADLEEDQNFAEQLSHCDRPRGTTP